MSCPRPDASKGIGDYVRYGGAREHADAKPQQCRDKEAGEGSERRFHACVSPAAPGHTTSSLGEAEKDQAHEDGADEIRNRCCCPNFGDDKGRESENAGADNQVKDACSQGSSTNSTHQANFHLAAKGCCACAVLHEQRRTFIKRQTPVTTVAGVPASDGDLCAWSATPCGRERSYWTVLRNWCLAESHSNGRSRQARFSLVEEEYCFTPSEIAAVYPSRRF